MTRVVSPGVLATPRSQDFKSSDDTQDSQSSYVWDLIAEHCDIVAVVRAVSVTIMITKVGVSLTLL